MAQQEWEYTKQILLGIFILAVVFLGALYFSGCGWKDTLEDRREDILDCSDQYRGCVRRSVKKCTDAAMDCRDEYLKKDEEKVKAEETKDAQTHRELQ